MSCKIMCSTRAGLMLLLAVLGASARCEATTLQRMSLDQLARAADTVVRARCVGSTARWENGAIWTFSEFEVVKRFRGEAPARFQIRLPGGRIGGIATHVEDVPQFRAGDEAVLFLEPRPDGNYGVTAWVEGTFRIRKASGDGREFVTQDSSGIAVFDPATRRFRSEGVRNLPWNEFRQRLSNALSAARNGVTR